LADAAGSVNGTLRTPTPTGGAFATSGGGLFRARLLL
jgi:hypothetical protein